MTPSLLQATSHRCKRCVDIDRFTVTGVDGKFEPKGLPPGDYVIGAVQEKMGEKDINVSVAADKAAKANSAFAVK